MVECKLEAQRLAHFRQEASQEPRALGRAGRGRRQGQADLQVGEGPREGGGQRALRRDGAGGEQESAVRNAADFPTTQDVNADLARVT